MLTALFVVTGLWSSQDKFDFSRDFSRFLEGLCRFLESFRDFPGLCRWWVTLWEASRRVLLRCPVKMEICLEKRISLRRNWGETLGMKGMIWFHMKWWQKCTSEEIDSRKEIMRTSSTLETGDQLHQDSTSSVADVSLIRIIMRRRI